MRDAFVALSGGIWSPFYLGGFLMGEFCLGSGTSVNLREEWRVDKARRWSGLSFLAAVSSAPLGMHAVSVLGSGQSV